MSVARFIADQRTMYRVPHTVVCALLGVSLSWFYKWLGRAHGPGAASGLHTPGTGAATPSTARSRSRSGRPAACTARPGCTPTCAMTAGRSGEDGRRLDAPPRPGGKADQAQERADQAGQDGTEVPRPAQPGLHRRRPNARWVGDMTEIPTGRGSCTWRP